MLGKAVDKVFRHELGDAPNIMDKMRPFLWVKVLDKLLRAN
jgi:hypothetical protein